ncbi:MAG: hypothetical protein R2856_39065 [Caldilineaceae bacterium]
MAFFLEHWLLQRNPDVIIGPFSEFLVLPLIQTGILFFLFFTQRSTMLPPHRPPGRNLPHHHVDHAGDPTHGDDGDPVPRL